MEMVCSLNWWRDQKALQTVFHLDGGQGYFRQDRGGR